MYMKGFYKVEVPGKNLSSGSTFSDVGTSVLKMLLASL